MTQGMYEIEQRQYFPFGDREKIFCYIPLIPLGVRKVNKGLNGNNEPTGIEVILANDSLDESRLEEGFRRVDKGWVVWKGGPPFAPGTNFPLMTERKILYEDGRFIVVDSHKWPALNLSGGKQNANT